MKAGAWPVPPVFDVIAREGGVSFEEMHRVFNMGDRHGRLPRGGRPGPRAAELWKTAGQRWYAIGNVRGGGSRRVVVEPTPEA